MFVTINLTASYESEEDFTTEESHFSLSKSNEEIEFNEEDLQKTIKKMIRLVKDAKKRTPFAIVEEVPVQLNEITFSFTVLDEDEKELEEFTEYYIFEEAIQYDDLTELIEEYFNTTISGLEEPVWTDPDFPIPFGTAAILNLAKKDLKFVPEYISFLKKNDLDHETEQMWHVLDIVDAHGWNAETLRLATTRLLTCSGQSGPEQFEALYKGYRHEANDYQSEETGPLEPYLNDHKQLFLSYVQQEFRDYALNFPGRFDDSLEYCYKQMNHVLEELKKYLSDEEMKTVNFELEKVWERAPKDQ